MNLFKEGSVGWDIVNIAAIYTFSLVVGLMIIVVGVWVFGGFSAR